jgi:hypothetical protein
MDIGIATAVYHDIAVGTETGISGIQQAGNSQQSQYTSCHAGKEVKGCTLPVRRAERNGYRFGSQIRFANLRFRITFYFFVEISEQRSIDRSAERGPDTGASKRMKIGNRAV